MLNLAMKDKSFQSLCNVLSQSLKMFRMFKGNSHYVLTNIEEENYLENGMGVSFYIPLFTTFNGTKGEYKRLAECLNAIITHTQENKTATFNIIRGWLNDSETKRAFPSIYKIHCQKDERAGSKYVFFTEEDFDYPFNRTAQMFGKLIMLSYADRKNFDLFSNKCEVYNDGQLITRFWKNEMFQFATKNGVIQGIFLMLRYISDTKEALKEIDSWRRNLGDEYFNSDKIVFNVDVDEENIEHNGWLHRYK